MRKRDDLRIRGGKLASVQLDSELVMFAQSAVLGTFVAEHRRQIVRFHRQSLLRKPVFDECARNASRPFGAQSHTAVPLVEEGVHFLVDDVRGFAHSPGEKFGMLESGGAHLAETEKRGDFSRLVLDPMPLVGILRQHILCALGDSNHIPSVRRLPRRIIGSKRCSTRVLRS